MNWEGHPGQVHYELNYLVSEETALNVRAFARSCLELEERSVGQPSFSYPVHNLYLDSDDFTLYWRAINDPEHRVELRVRYYSLERGEPVLGSSHRVIVPQE